MRPPDPRGALGAEQPWPAPAKLNLFLHVTGRRADGYHLLQTVFQFLDCGDDLEFSVRTDGRILRPAGPDGIAEDDDLTCRAARALQAATGTRLGAEIRLRKRIPLGAGLGGGSSDAATTLVALNRLWDTGLDQARLATVGLALGADVPVFIHGHAAWAEGVGEQLHDVTLPEPWYLVATPPVAVSTREIFAAPELRRECAPATLADFLAGRCSNVCEPVTFARYPEVQRAYQALSRFGTARMTGTGASCFVAFDSRDAARHAQEQLPREWTSFVARALNRSPLAAIIAAA
jgi:4-diphosphocytidyl-2-C-methyl-D-erythritol kinase